VLTTDTARTAATDPGSAWDLAVKTFMADLSFHLLAAPFPGMTHPGCGRRTAASVTSVARPGD
jgi:hypothetical protein